MAADGSTDAEIKEAINAYAAEFQRSLDLIPEDFEGDAVDDYKYGFRMPVSCNDANSCTWVCENFVRADGISDEVTDSA